MTSGEKIGVALASGLALYLAYREGAKASTPVKLPYDNNGTNVPTDMRLIQIIAERIYEGDKGANIPWFSEHDEQAYQQALSFSNTDFVELYNVFNAKYKSIISETLTPFIQSQWAAQDSTYGVLQATMLQRLASLNLP